MSEMETDIDASWGVDFTGDQTVKFMELDFREKPYGAWMCLKFAHESGKRASVSGNLFTAANPADNLKTANRITMEMLGEVFRAFGLNEADMPAKNPAAIKKALEAYVENVSVIGTIGKDSDGKYDTIKKFAKA